MGRTLAGGPLIGVALVAALLCGGAVLNYRNVRQLSEDAGWVAHSHLVLDLSEAVLLALADAETAQRGYLFTRQDDFLRAYREARGGLEVELADLREQTRDNPRQQARLDQLDAIQSWLLAHWQEGIDHPPPLDPARRLPRGAMAHENGVITLRQQMAALQGEERTLLGERTRRSELALAGTQTTGLLSTTLGLTVLAAYVWLLHRSLEARSRAAETAHTERERFRTTLASIGDAVIVTDKKGRITFLNAVAEKLTGWKAEALSQELSTVFHIVNETSGERVENPVTRVLREGQVVGLANHTDLIARDGTRLPIDDCGAPIRTAAGEIAGVVLVFRDVTQRKQAEENLLALNQELEAQRAFFESVLRRMPVGVLMADARSGTLRFCNPAAERIVGFPFEPNRQLTDYDPLHGIVGYRPDGTRLEANDWPLARALLHREEVTDQWIDLARPDGSRSTLRTSAAPIRDGGGRIVAAVVVFTDVTAMKRVERELRQASQRFRSLADSIPQLAWMTRPDGDIFWYNQRWYDYTGLTLEQTQGQGWRQVHDPAEVERVWASWQAAISTGSPWEDTFPLRRSDGTFRWHLSRAMPIKDEEGRVVEYVGTNTDITELRSMQEALREADRRKDEFLATLAHELRNPLAPLRNGLQVLRLSPDAPEREQARAMMERQLGQMVRLIDDLLDVSRLRSNKLQLRRALVNLAAVIENAVETVRPRIEERGHVLEVSLPAEPIYLDADLTRLAQVFWNLLHNSAKYTDPGGRIFLTAERDGGEVVVRVRDTGIGIPVEALPNLFALFSQVTRTLERGEGGLGIGLALVRGLVEMHGGTVEAHSAGAGRGSEFVVRLPVADGFVLPEFALLPAVSLGPRRQILVVDDNRDGAASLSTMLSLLGHDTRTAHDGLEAIELAEAFRPEVILLDIGLPKLNGYDVCQRLRAGPLGQAVVIIATTGWGGEEDRRRSRQAGFDHHLVKPVDPDVLMELLRSLPVPPR